MKIDIYSHILPQKFLDAFSKRVGEKHLLRMLSPRPPVTQFDVDRCNIDMRFRIMEEFADLVQVLTPTGHTLEGTASPEDAAYLAKVYNDEMAELVLKYPDKFVAAVACLPLNNIDASLREIDRAINELGFKGILMNTPINGKPLDLPELEPVYESMSNYDLPIWIHPTRLSSVVDYVNEDESKYLLFQVLGWPYETSIAMGRLVCSGILDRYPDLKLVTHHAGGMIPFFAGRVNRVKCSFGQEITGEEPPLKAKTPMEYFRRFYADTALYGNTPGLMCAHAFFGTEHLLFGTDMPYGPDLGKQYTSQTINAIEAMSISDSDKKRIFEENARLLLHLDI